MYQGVGPHDRSESTALCSRSRTSYGGCNRARKFLDKPSLVDYLRPHVIFDKTLTLITRAHVLICSVDAGDIAQ